ncbi:MAG TPA: AI-2E family transporter [Burkholderiales bacterium]|jgi:predicted PurR-regulated permease PerM
MQTSERIFYTRAFALIALLLVGYLLYLVLSPFFAPIAWSLFIAFLVYPLHAWLTRRLRGRAALSAALLTLATFLLVIGPLAALGAAFGAQVGDLARGAQAFAAEHKPSDLSDLASLPVVGPAVAWLQQNTGISIAQFQAWAVEGAQAILKGLGTVGRAAFLGALGTVIGFALMMFILFFAIRDGKRMADTVRALVPASDADKARLFRHLASVTRALVYGTGVTALAQGLLVGIGFAIVGLPSPVVFGVLAALAALVPLAGTPVVWVPAMIVLAAQDRWGAALFMLLWGAFVVTIDNFLRPWLVSGRAQIDALTVFIGVLGGVSAFGPIGVFLGPLVLALVIALVRFSLEGQGEERR